jgi:hypothetical protein
VYRRIFEVSGKLVTPDRGVASEAGAAFRDDCGVVGNWCQNRLCEYEVWGSRTAPDLPSDDKLDS